MAAILYPDPRPARSSHHWIASALFRERFDSIVKKHNVIKPLLDLHGNAPSLLEWGLNPKDAYRYLPLHRCIYSPSFSGSVLQKTRPPPGSAGGTGDRLPN